MTAIKGVFPEGSVEIVQGDMMDKASLVKAFQGAEKGQLADRYRVRDLSAHASGNSLLRHRRHPRRSDQGNQNGNQLH